MGAETVAATPDSKWIAEALFQWLGHKNEPQDFVEDIQTTSLARWCERKRWRASVDRFESFAASLVEDDSRYAESHKGQRQWWRFVLRALNLFRDRRRQQLAGPALAHHLGQAPQPVDEASYEYARRLVPADGTEILPHLLPLGSTCRHFEVDDFCSVWSIRTFSSDCPSPARPSLVNSMGTFASATLCEDGDVQTSRSFK